MRYLKFVWKYKFVLPPVIALLALLYLVTYFMLTSWWTHQIFIAKVNITWIKTAQASEMTVEQYACSKGWNCKVAKAIFQAESGFNAYAINKNNDKGGTLDLGCAQLNEKWQLKPKGITREQAFDCRFSIDVAHQIYVEWGHTFDAWSSYKSGAYKKFLN